MSTTINPAKITEFFLASTALHQKQAAEINRLKAAAAQSVKQAAAPELQHAIKEAAEGLVTAGLVRADERSDVIAYISKPGGAVDLLTKLASKFPASVQPLGKSVTDDGQLPSTKTAAATSRRPERPSDAAFKAAMSRD